VHRALYAATAGRICYPAHIYIIIYTFYFPTFGAGTKKLSHTLMHVSDISSHLVVLWRQRQSMGLTATDAAEIADRILFGLRGIGLAGC